MCTFAGTHTVPNIVTSAEMEINNAGTRSQDAYTDPEYLTRFSTEVPISQGDL